MQVINDQKSLKNILNDFKNKNKKISLIPTMGNLHSGHLELFDRAPSDSIKVVTIYINPLQFNDQEDYKNYPRSVKSDIEKCDKKNIDIVYSPHGCITDEIAFEENIDLPKFTRYLCGSTRDNHFLGVYKIVKHLFSIIQPDFACFGKKDYQQLLLIKYIASTYFPNLKIIDVDIVRENKIPLSSRLYRLNNNSLSRLKLVYDTLIVIRKDMINGGNFMSIKQNYIREIESNNISVEYLEHRRNDTLEDASNYLKNSSLFIAYFVDNIRLIDNIQI